MKLVNRWLGMEIVFVQVGHGLIGAALIGIVAANVPWWFLLALTPLILFSLAYWLMEASFVLPVARRLISGDPMTVRETKEAPSGRCEDRDG